MNIFYGRKSQLASTLIDYLSKKELVVFTENATEKKHFKQSSTYLAKRLKEKVEHCVIFMQTQSDINNVKHLLDKCNDDNSLATVLIPARSIEKLNFKKLALKKHKVAILGDVYNDFVSGSDISKIFQKAIRTSEIELEYDNSKSICIISLDQAIEQILNLLHSNAPEKRYLFYENPQTLALMALQLVKVIPEVTIKYSKHIAYSPVSQENIKTSSVLKIEASISKCHFSKTFESEVAETSKKSVTPNSSTKKVNDTKRLSFFSKSLALVMGGIFVYYALNSIILGGAYIRINMMDRGFEETTVEEITKSLSEITLLANLTSPALTPLSPFLPNEFQNARKLTNILTKLLDFAKNTSLLNSQNPTSLISALSYLYFTADDNHELLKEIQTSENTKILSALIPVINSFQEGEQTYLILFQNNAELRPTGGFIGSVGELKIKEGKIEDITITDVYNIDGQLTTHIEPHYIIRRNLQPHLYLRDSNFDIEFPENAKNSALIYTAATGKRVDGVVAIDFEVLKSILEEIDTVNLPTYGKTITKDNAREFIQNQIEENFFPGSSQKKDILNEVMTRTLIKLEEDNQLKLRVAKKIPQLITNKHVQLMSFDTNIQKILEANGLAGTIEYSDNHTAINDIVGVNEANIGVNKANQFISRRLEYTVSIEDRITGTASLRLFNTHKKSMDYKTYVRFITPPGSQLQSIKINGESQNVIPAVTDPQIYESPTFQPQLGLEVDEYQDTKYKTYGFVTTVKKGSSQQIDVTYTTGLTYSPHKTEYIINLDKQPGTTDLPIKLSLATQKIENSNIQGSQAKTKSEVISRDNQFIFELKPSQ